MRIFANYIRTTIRSYIRANIREYIRTTIRKGIRANIREYSRIVEGEYANSILVFAPMPTPYMHLVPGPPACHVNRSGTLLLVLM